MQQVDVHIAACGASDVARLRDGSCHLRGTGRLFNATRNANIDPQCLQVANGPIVSYPLMNNGCARGGMVDKTVRSASVNVSVHLQGTTALIGCWISGAK